MCLIKGRVIGLIRANLIKSVRQFTSTCAIHKRAIVFVFVCPFQNSLQFHLFIYMQFNPKLNNQFRPKQKNTISLQISHKMRFSLELVNLLFTSSCMIIGTNDKELMLSDYINKMAIARKSPEKRERI